MVSDCDYPHEEKFQDILRPSAWRINHRGTHWRRYGDWTISVFAKWGMYVWCINFGDNGDPRYSREKFASIEDAKENAAYTICED